MFFNDKIESVYQRENIELIEENYIVREEENKKEITFKEENNVLFKKYQAYFIKYDIENEEKIVTIEAKYEGIKIQEEELEIGRTQGIFDIIIYPIDQDITKLKFEISQREGTIINKLNIYGIKEFKIPAVHTKILPSEFKYNYAVKEGNNYNYYFLYLGKYKQVINQETYELTKEEFLQNHINHIRSKEDTFRYFYNDFTNSKKISKLTGVYHFVNENEVSRTRYDFGQGFGEIRAMPKNIIVQEINAIDENGKIKVYSIVSNDYYSNKVTRYVDENNVIVREENNITFPKEYTFNSYGQIVSERMQNESDKYMLKENIYDSKGNIVVQKNLNQNITYGYDEYNRCICDNEYNYKKITYDNMDNIETISKGTKNILFRTTNRYTYNKESRLEEVRLEKANIVNPDITDIERRITYEYDEYGRIKAIKQGEQVLGEITYSFREITIKTEDKGIRSYKYDEYGHLVEKRVGKDINTLKSEIVNIYNKEYGISEEIIDPYDVRLKRDSTSLLVATISNGERTTYNQEGNIKIIEGSCKVIETESDIQIDELIYENQSDPRNPNIQKQKIYNNQETKHSLYIINTIDEFGRISEKEYKCKIENQENDNEYEAIKSKYIYQEEDNRVNNIIKGIEINKGESNLLKEEYTYDNFLRVTSKINTKTSEKEEYTYDECNRLSTVKRNDKTYSYTYDKFGNIIQRKENNLIDKTMKYDMYDRIIQYNEKEYTYHEGATGYDTIVEGTDIKSRLYTNGRLQSEIYENDDGEEIYTYYSVYYTYDGEGRIKERYSSYSNGLSTTKTYIYLGEKLVAVKEGENKLSIYYENNQAVRFLYQNEIYRYIINALGK